MRGLGAECSNAFYMLLEYETKLFMYPLNTVLFKCTMHRKVQFAKRSVEKHNFLREKGGSGSTEKHKKATNAQKHTKS